MLQLNNSETSKISKSFIHLILLSGFAVPTYNGTKPIPLLISTKKIGNLCSSFYI